MLYSASHQEEEYVPIGDMSRQLKISSYFLTRILQKLSKYGWLVSCRGPNGGIKLAKNAGDIRVMDIVSYIDGLKLFNNCILGLAGCKVETSPSAACQLGRPSGGDKQRF